MTTPDLLPRLRSGCCGDPCRVMDARSGCACAEAADEIERLEAALAKRDAPTLAALDELAAEIASATLPMDSYSLEYILIRGYDAIGVPGIRSAKAMCLLLARAQLEEMNEASAIASEQVES